MLSTPFRENNSKRVKYEDAELPGLVEISVSRLSPSLREKLFFTSLASPFIFCPWKYKQKQPTPVFWYTNSCHSFQSIPKKSLFTDFTTTRKQMKPTDPTRISSQKESSRHLCVYVGIFVETRKQLFLQYSNIIHFSSSRKTVTRTIAKWR